MVSIMKKNKVWMRLSRAGPFQVEGTASRETLRERVALATLRTNQGARGCSCVLGGELCMGGEVTGACGGHNSQIHETKGDSRGTLGMQQAGYLHVSS